MSFFSSWSETGLGNALLAVGKIVAPIDDELSDDIKGNISIENSDFKNIDHESDNSSYLSDRMVFDECNESLNSLGSPIIDRHHGNSRVHENSEIVAEMKEKISCLEQTVTSLINDQKNLEINVASKEHKIAELEEILKCQNTNSLRTEAVNTELSGINDELQVDLSETYAMTIAHLEEKVKLVSNQKEDEIKRILRENENVLTKFENELNLANKRILYLEETLKESNAQLVVANDKLINVNIQLEDHVNIIANKELEINRLLNEVFMKILLLFPINVRIFLLC